MRALAASVGYEHEKGHLMSCNCNSSGFFVARAKPLGRARLAIMVALLFAGCGPMGLGAADAVAPSSAAVAPDAIALTADLYMLPMGADDAGCPTFQPWSPTMAVVQALHWRRADGGFTLDRSEADCP